MRSAQREYDSLIRKPGEIQRFRQRNLRWLSPNLEVAIADTRPAIRFAESTTTAEVDRGNYFMLPTLPQ